MDESPPFAASFDDPRISTQFCRRVRRTESSGDCILLGVVHDHPASIARIERVLESIEPETVALELPSAALPLYRTYARDAADGPPRFGGEMSAAIQAAPDSAVVGIDAPNWSFVRRLVTRLIADRVAPSTARRVLSGLGGATREALTCRVAATLTHATSMTVACDDPIDYDCDHDDPPERQASHERSHVASVQALLGSVATEGSALTYRDDTRERCMIDRLEGLRTETDGDIVAVVGVDHLERLADALSA